MSTVAEVLKRYHAKVPFPITSAKIEAAGYDVKEYLKAIVKDIQGAEDSHDPLTQDFLRKVHLMEWTHK